jgi:TPR repeat protein
LRQNPSRVTVFNGNLIAAAAIVLILTVLTPSCFSLTGWFSDSPDEAPSGSQNAVGEIKPAGEAEFLAGDFRTARTLLTNAGRAGSLRAVFFLRIITQYGLDGLPPNPDEAKRFLALLANSKDRLIELAAKAPLEDRPIYDTALAHLYFTSYFAPLPDYAAAITLSRQAAETGFTPAMNLSAAIILTPEAAEATSKMLGNIFGQAGPAEAFSWSHKAALAGDVLAMGNVSYLYRAGLGTNRDPLMAASWARRAADKPQTSARCFNDLGYFYQLGTAVSPDLTEAARWYKLAADRQYPLAAANLSGLKAKPPAAPSVFDGLEY